MQVNGLKQETRLTAIYVPSVAVDCRLCLLRNTAAIEMILTSQCRFELFWNTFPVTPASINGHKIRLYLR